MKGDAVSSKTYNVDWNNSEPHKTTCFTKDAFPEIAFFLETMPQVRFELITQLQHFVDSNSKDEQRPKIVQNQPYYSKYY
jgi:hypothetical protein